ncbi:MAG: DNA cytosine methyltransferase [Holosporaceae bacterium]|nr:DNA cytosine methyltransferase [Holosporaceae bacterium]
MVSPGSSFTFVDLFAGIGGIRKAFQNLGGRCVFSSEIDPFARKTYCANFDEEPFGDITKINKCDIPDHDILAAGFPCQAFSIAGKRGGFNDTRGTLFFEVADILKVKKAKAFFLENVKGLANHKQGKTLETILNVLRNDLGYVVPDPKIINARDYGVPQNRERIFIVGFRGDLGIKAEDFSYPAAVNFKKSLKDILEDKPVSFKYYLSSKYLECLQKHKNRNAAKGNGFGYEILDPDSVANALVVGGMGKERNLVRDERLENSVAYEKINKDGIRKMTPREWARVQGFPDSFKIPVSDSQAYKQFGNSVAVPAVQAVAEVLIKLLNDRGLTTRRI